MFHVKSVLIILCKKYSDHLDLLHLKDDENDQNTLKVQQDVTLVLQNIMEKDTFSIVVYNILEIKGFYISSEKFV